MQTQRSILISGCLLSALFALGFNLMPVTLASAAQHFGLDPQQVGLLAMSALGGVVIGSSLTFALAHKLTWNAIAAIGAVIASAGYSASTQATADNLNLLFICWFIGGLGTGLPFSIAIQALAEMGNQEKVMGIKLGSEVFLGAVLLYLFPVLFVARWGYTGAAIGLAAFLLLGLTAVKYIPTAHKTGAKDDQSVEKVCLKDNLPAVCALIMLIIFFGGQSGTWVFLEIIGIEIGVEAESRGFVLAVTKILGGVAGVTAAIAGAKYGVRWPHLLGFATITLGLYLINGATKQWHLGLSTWDLSTWGLSTWGLGAWLWEFGFALSQCYMMAAIVVLDRSYRLAVLIPAALGIGAAAGPAIAGALKTGESYQPIFFFAIVCALLACGVISALMSRQSPQRVESPSAETAQG